MPEHYMLDSAIFTGSVHPLEYQEQRKAVGCIKQALLALSFWMCSLSNLLILLLRLIERFTRLGHF